MDNRLRTILAVLFVVGLWTAPAHAQRTSGAAGLGGQIGEPTGVTLKIYNENSPSYDFLAAWDLDNFFFLNAHALFENDLNEPDVDPDLEWFIGPGAYIGADDDLGDDAILGVSGTIGLNLVFDRRVEVYGQLTPRINLIPDTDGQFGGGLGLRYYF